MILTGDKALRSTLEAMLHWHDKGEHLDESWWDALRDVLREDAAVYEAPALSLVPVDVVG